MHLCYCKYSTQAYTEEPRVCVCFRWQTHAIWGVTHYSAVEIQEPRCSLRK